MVSTGGVKPVSQPRIPVGVRDIKMPHVDLRWILTYKLIDLDNSFLVWDSCIPHIANPIQMADPTHI